MLRISERRPTRSHSSNSNKNNDNSFSRIMKNRGIPSLLPLEVCTLHLHFNTISSLHRIFFAKRTTDQKEISKRIEQRRERPSEQNELGLIPTNFKRCRTDASSGYGSPEIGSPKASSLDVFEHFIKQIPQADGSIENRRLRSLIKRMLLNVASTRKKVSKNTRRTFRKILISHTTKSDKGSVPFDPAIEKALIKLIRKSKCGHALKVADSALEDPSTSE